MPKEKKCRVVIDTNIWISYLTGKRLKELTEDIFKSRLIQIILSEELFNELIDITQREKFKSKFQDSQVKELISVLESITEKVVCKSKVKICRDPDDDFILTVCNDGKADFLVTGDKDLLVLNTFLSTKIITANQFEIELAKLSL